MSGDVQPRKRKDKKRKKDELGVEEPRGTSAALGEGDVFMHSQHEHGTGGHWCAKIIFFSLLAVLITLVGLIILENRGLSELEANSVETRYSGVLEGWLEDAPDDDHHDVHTLELNHHDDEDDHDDDDEIDDGDEDEHDEDELAEEHESDEVGHDEDGHDDDDEEQDDERDVGPTDEDEDETLRYRKYFGDDDEDETENDGDDEHEGDDEELNYENDDEQNDEDDDETQNDEDDDETQNHYERDTAENDDDDDEQSIEKFEVDDDDNDEENDDAQDDEDDEEHGDDHEEDDAEIEVERIEKEASEEEEPISLELPALPEDDDDDDDNDKEHDKDDDNDEDNTAEDEADDDDKDDDDDFLEADDDFPVVERITAPAGKPFVEVEEASSERPPDTLEEEEEYEKQQEELRKEEEQASHMWLKLAVGGALLVATHAVMRRATGPRDTPEREERVAREETPIDRRMTLIPEESTEYVTPKMSHESYFDEEVTKKVYAAKSAPVKQPSEEEEDQDDIEVIEEEREEQKEQDKELYSDEEEVEDEEEEIVEEKIEVPKQIAPAAKKPAPVPEPEEKEDDVPDDVEIIDEEHLEEELDEEDEDEEEISDVDDVELLSRLEAKYGRLPEPERPGQRHKDGGNSIEDEWPGEPSDPYWRQQLDSIERELRQGAWLAAAERASAPELAGSARARLLAATALDRAAEAQRDNRLLSRAIAAYLHLLKMNERIPDKKLVEVCNRTLDRMQFRGNYLNAEPVYRLLIRRFPNDPTHRNNLSVSFLMANRADLAEEVLKETLMRWPNDRVALAHYAFVLKTQHNRLEEAVESFQKALSGDEGPACEPRFYYHLGDALLLLGRHTEAHEVHKRGAKLGHFLSSAQRSLYNVPRLKSRPWWNVEETPYVKLARALENSWKEILKEGEAARASYEKEKEGLKERGEWSQLDLFARGREIPDRCARAPVTCAVVRSEAAAVGCRRGQVKFSAMEPGTHVRAHVGPTNCRLRMHLALANTEGTFLRVDQETRQWREGRVLMFDDSFEHEVWHNGTRRRLVLIVDVWHPDLTDTERRTLTAI